MPWFGARWLFWTSLLALCAALAVVCLYRTCTCSGPSDATGIVFIKTYKTGSSTLAGICRRIGHRRQYSHTNDAYWLDAEQRWQSLCGRAGWSYRCSAAIWANHEPRAGIEHKLRALMPNAVYITIVRDPVARCLSDYYHIHVFRRQGVDSAKAKLKWIESCKTDFLTDYIGRKTGQEVADALGSYDAVMITERFTESLVAFRGILNASLTDVLHLSSKVSGSEPTDRTDRAKMLAFKGTQKTSMPAHPPLQSEPKEVQVAASAKWNSSKDLELVALANDALDRRISLLGAQFQSDLAAFSAMLEEVNRVCQKRFFEDCLWNDNGCGQGCIDDLAAERGWT
eukprot:TRINITY_DN66199_c0_g1_i1.p1 TRINITY_DN66199_c0_g1~~TRINITY_DN66199_c0_g1_i1.p1  ORF type:complete len:341 (+),score=48.49 TRINITY_DN66199_c0_g1_i1:31-1053(+)